MTTNNSEIANEKKLAEKISRPVRIDEKTNQGLTGHPSKDMFKLNAFPGRPLTRQLWCLPWSLPPPLTFHLWDQPGGILSLAH